MAFTLAQLRSSRMARKFFDYAVANDVECPSLDVVLAAVNAVETNEGVTTASQHNSADPTKTMDLINNADLNAMHSIFVGASGVPLKLKAMIMAIRVQMKLAELEGSI